MSEGAKRTRAGSGKARQRRKGPPRGGRYGLSRPVVIAPDGNALSIESAIDPAPSFSARRMVSAATPRISGLSREAEFAYIRSDMRRLLFIAGGLFALMLVILVAVGR